MAKIEKTKCMALGISGFISHGRWNKKIVFVYIYLRYGEKMSYSTPSVYTILTLNVEGLPIGQGQTRVKNLRPFIFKIIECNFMNLIDPINWLIL